MKKLTLLMIAVLIGSFGFAQQNLNLTKKTAKAVANTASQEKAAWLAYCEDIESAVFTDEAYEIETYSRFTAADLNEYNNQYLTTVGFVPTSDTCTYSIIIYKGGSYVNGIITPGTKVMEQNVNSADLYYYTWNNVVLNSAVQINSAEELWIGIRCVVSDACYFAGVDDSVVTVEGKGNIAFDSDGWSTLSLMGLSGNWTIKGYVEEQEISKVTVSGTVTSSINGAAISGASVKFASDSHYQSSTTNANGEYTIELNRGYVYSATVMASNFGIHLLDSLVFTENTTKNFQLTPITAINENSKPQISIYPNPANDIINISGAENSRVDILNVIGEVVATIESASVNQTVNVSSFSKGIYFVRIKNNVYKINITK